MERQEFIYFVLGAFSLAVGFIVQPYVKAVWKWFKSLISHKQPVGTDPAVLAKLEELQTQINNIVETKYNRETNRKNNIRREVRDYLKELRNSKTEKPKNKDQWN